MSDEITQRGMAKLREIFEKEHLHQQTATSDAIDGDFRERVNDTLFGRVWCDEALSTEQLSLLLIHPAQSYAANLVYS